MIEGIKRILKSDATTAAQRILGCLLVRELDGRKLTGKIVETEAYDQTDAANHSYRGQTPRTDVMFGPAGHLYVYFTYGMHYCCNIVTGAEGHGAAVLLRALEPLEGEDIMIQLRQADRKNLLNGPAKICQALAIDKALNGHDLRQRPLQLILRPALPKSDIIQTTRIGIRHAVDKPWRFYIKNSPYVSRPTKS